ncbi:hypothetical protein ADL15_49665 [Actinoplanes awajinensis subsp. mycoplanecinus]|uniref:Uncharacterized protein n=1 Tax=Actinoplanes awajinensis subsp. mycoplanecinus TaxID=135947 RepID=A0A101J842_9ACTN|nr:hypothetical protein ADL15_49665 [Actinoplanes awajinensis subsp. mycoplanecinus]
MYSSVMAASFRRVPTREEVAAPRAWWFSTVAWWVAIMWAIRSSRRSRYFAEALLLSGGHASARFSR